MADESTNSLVLRTQNMDLINDEIKCIPLSCIYTTFELTKEGKRMLSYTEQAVSNPHLNSICKQIDTIQHGSSSLDTKFNFLAHESCGSNISRGISGST
mmetsp:Transcript_12008/g.13433  ORF Transcript_12008/g.13433 Transcript_12008/m.13433 type:complete len:99 (+) Transcript_12008:1768-2064(+)